jgi:orotidine-5'-phosphate decarboxylase
MPRIIQRDRSIIPACDVSFKTFREIVKNTAEVPGVGAYKVGVAFLDIGLKKVVDTAREYTNKPIIYDHQKAGTDIPEQTPDSFMDAMLRASVNAVILFPQAGPITEYEWIKAAQDRGIGVIVGGEMTHPRYLEGDLSETKKKNYTQIFQDLGIDREISGFIRKFAPEDMYEIATRMKVTNFVVPGNKPDRIKYYKSLIESCKVTDPDFYSPGLVAQGGEISEGAEAAGKRFHAIVGRGIYEPKDIKAAALQLTSQLG